VLCGRQCSVAGTAPLLTACSVSASRGQSSVAGSASCRQCAVAGSALLQAVRCCRQCAVVTQLCVQAQLKQSVSVLVRARLRSSVCRHSTCTRQSCAALCAGTAQTVGVSICTNALASASVLVLLYLRVLHIGEEIRGDSTVTWHEFARSMSPEEIIWVPLRVIEQALRDIPHKRPRCIYV
jgi:hypothetical protein